MNRRAWQTLLTVLLLAALYAQADWRAVAQAVARLDLRLFLAAMALFVPQTLVSAWRWGSLIAARHRQPWAESLRQILAANAMNLVLPAKAGDFTKAGLVSGDVPRRWLTIRAVAEKAADAATLAGLALIGLAATYGTPLQAALAAAGWFALGVLAWRRLADRANATGFLAALGWQAQTALLWLLHLAQIQLFLWAAGVSVGPAVAAPRIAAALFAGLLPISFLGIGTRDAVLTWAFADVAPAATMAVVGLLTALRYVGPGLVGIAVAPRYLPRRSASVPSRSATSLSSRKQANPSPTTAGV